MRKIDLEDYTAYNKVPDQANIGELIDIQYVFHVKDTIMAVLFAPIQRLSGARLVKTHAVAQKIEAAKDYVLLEQAEYELVKEAFDKFEGFGRNDVELVERINKAGESQVNMREDKRRKKLGDTEK